MESMWSRMTSSHLCSGSSSKSITYLQKRVFSTVPRPSCFPHWKPQPASVNQKATHLFARLSATVIVRKTRPKRSRERRRNITETMDQGAPFYDTQEREQKRTFDPVEDEKLGREEYTLYWRESQGSFRNEKKALIPKILPSLDFLRSWAFTTLLEKSHNFLAITIISPSALWPQRGVRVG